MTAQKEQLDQYPISLKHIQDLVERVSCRYPALPKYKTALIIKKFFELIRHLLIAGNSISINGLFPNMHLVSFAKFIKNSYSRTTKIKLSTPSKMRQI